MPIPAIGTPIADVKTGRINEIWYRWFFDVSTRLDTLTSDLSTLTTLVTPIEGSWTPVLAFGGLSTGITYATQIGRYIKQGNLVSIWLTIELTNNGSAIGNATITGLPYTSSTATALNFSGTISDFDKIGIPDIPMCSVDNNTSIIILKHFDITTGSIDTMASADFNSNSTISIQLTYRTG